MNLDFGEAAMDLGIDFGGGEFGAASEPEQTSGVSRPCTCLDLRLPLWTQRGVSNITFNRSSNYATPERRATGPNEEDAQKTKTQGKEKLLIRSPNFVMALEQRSNGVAHLDSQFL